MRQLHLKTNIPPAWRAVANWNGRHCCPIRGSLRGCLENVVGTATAARDRSPPSLTDHGCHGPMPLLVDPLDPGARPLDAAKCRPVNGERQLNAARLDLHSITIENDIEYPLTGNDAISRVVDISVGADNRNAKVSDAVGIRYRTRVR